MENLIVAFGIVLYDRYLHNFSFPNHVFEPRSSS